MKKKFIYVLMKQSTERGCYDEWVEHEGTYQECLRQMPNIERGYIIKYPAKYIEFPDSTDPINIVKTKGWD